MSNGFFSPIKKIEIEECSGDCAVFREFWGHWLLLVFLGSNHLFDRKVREIRNKKKSDNSMLCNNNT